MFEIQPSLD